MDVIDIERSILTNYRKTIFRPFTKAVMDYHLVEQNDHICVCVSGGKDSLVMAKCMQELERHGKFPIKCEYVLMNPGFSKENIEKIINNANSIGINLQVFDTNIFEAVKSAGRKTPCYVCAKMRRGALYSKAQELGCNKIALGHHYDDVIETTMLSILYNGIFNTMVPRIKSENYENMELIRPLYLVREEDIKNFVNRWNIDCQTCYCSLKEENSKRKEMKELIKELKKTNKYVESNIFRSSENVELDHIRGAIKNKTQINFHEYFDIFK